MVSSSVGRAMAATHAAKTGNFHRLMDIYPDKIVWADNDLRLILVRGEMGDSVPMSMLYAANFIILYDDKVKSFVVAKNRTGELTQVVKLLNDIFQVQSFEERNDTLYVSNEEDLMVLKLKGVL